MPMYNNDLLIYICNLIDDHNLTYILSRLEDRHFRSRYLPKQKTIIINTNWWYPPEVPFMAAHELGHYINGDKGVMYYAHDYEWQKHDAFNRNDDAFKEDQADLYSLNLIWDYASSQGYICEDPGEFMLQFGIPERMKKIVAKKFESNNDLLF
ncbi:putative toxin-antitoxin system, toxin component [Lactobacillus paragasseri JV-V03]|uniref:Toxin-antitoxin system, toxin component n=2 Tax=Lactobacillus paragasseri TaxID=2107999 RepID=A0AA87A1S7_9LACO|nr:putative toxin-antitoxin system, toxin component [Lactobacillus paragasseri JV-V03]